MMLVNVCACFDVMISHGGLQSCPVAVLSFFRYSAFFFFFFFLFYNALGLVRFSSYKDQCWAEKIIWIVLLNLHGATRSTRLCNNRASLSAYPGSCHSFCNTWVNTAQKMSMMKKLIRKFFIEAATCTAAKGWEESFKRWGKRAYEEYMECFCYRADCSTECLFVSSRCC